MKETLQITKEREVLSLVTGVTYAIVPTWYGGTYKDLKMDLIIPKNRENHPLCPAVVWICGGAFLVMDRSVWMPEMMFYAEKGYVVACVDYRTSNEVAFPAQLEDVKAAVRFLKAHAQQFCIDPDHIFVMGESAGGALAALTGVTGGRKEFDVGDYLSFDSTICGVVSYYGASAAGNDTPICRPHPNVPDWIMQALLFTMLGVLAEPTQVWEAKWVGLGAAVFLMFAARPLAVMICLLGSRFTMPERLLTAWVGLRGGAPIMLATFPLIVQLPQADFLFHIVFFIVLTSVLIQGMTIMPMAQLLKLAGPLRKTLRVPLSFEETGDANSDFRELPVPKERIGQSLQELQLPNGALVLLIRREDRFIVPRGHTRLESGDILTVMGTPEAIRESEEQLSAIPE